MSAKAMTASFAERLDAGLDGLPGWCQPPDSSTRQRLRAHGEVLLKWNRTHNLTSLSAIDEVVEALFVDAWLVTGLWPESTTGLIDVGSGGGFPGIVALASRPTLPGVLFEKVEKKRSFLRVAVAELGLGNVRVAADAFPSARERWPAAGTLFTCRATWAPEEWLAKWRAQARVGDYTIVQTAKEPLPDGAIRRETTTLPFSGAPRQLGLYLQQ